MMRATQEFFHALRVMIVGMGVVGLLSACTSEAEIELQRALPCPGVGILGGAENLTSFTGSGNDITDIALTAELERVVSQCEYDIDDGIIYVDLAVRGGSRNWPRGNKSRGGGANVHRADRSQFAGLEKRHIHASPHLRRKPAHHELHPYN